METKPPQGISLTSSTSGWALLAAQRLILPKLNADVHWVWTNDAEGKFVSCFNSGKDKITSGNAVVSDVNWLQGSQHSSTESAQRLPTLSKVNRW